jgi:hypothetical protein
MLVIAESDFIVIGRTVIWPDRGVKLGVDAEASVRVMRSKLFEREMAAQGWERVGRDAWRHRDGRRSNTRCLVRQSQR